MSFGLWREKGRYLTQFDFEEGQLHTSIYDKRMISISISLSIPEQDKSSDVVLQWSAFGDRKKVIHCLKWEGLQNNWKHYIFGKLLSGAPDSRFRKLFVIRNAYNSDKKKQKRGDLKVQISVCINGDNFACNSHTSILSKRTK